MGEVLPPQMTDKLILVEFTSTPIPDDVENRICFGTIVYTDLYGEKYTTSWKHRVVREGKVLKTYALPGGYSSEWEA